MKFKDIAELLGLGDLSLARPLLSCKGCSVVKKGVTAKEVWVGTGDEWWCYSLLVFANMAVCPTMRCSNSYTPWLVPDFSCTFKRKECGSFKRFHSIPASQDCVL